MKRETKKKIMNNDKNKKIEAREIEIKEYKIMCNLIKRFYVSENDGRINKHAIFAHFNSFLHDADFFSFIFIF